jgi:fructose-bisphosphate aldolase, class II
LKTKTGIDTMAFSVGNMHLQKGQAGGLDEDRIQAIEAVTSVPLVIHGGSGVPAAQRQSLSRHSNICKFNIGTELRLAFGAALCDALARDPDRFDRLEIMDDMHAPLIAATRRVLQSLR